MPVATESYTDSMTEETLAIANARLKRAINRLVRWIVGTVLTGIAIAVAVTTAIGERELDERVGDRPGAGKVRGSYGGILGQACNRELLRRLDGALVPPQANFVIRT